ncbi:hypothetical protein GJ744_003929 [Endocarpon pusillum]|uniref:Uncharacterized protein n=1 Tax=Endocarpon pusillum TaxID=364733 RepID=A0A8H7DZH2_9EURO|nr:hypothetical protein GJ744_003929 [Endocarpon pusillum]
MSIPAFYLIFFPPVSVMDQLSPARCQPAAHGPDTEYLTISLEDSGSAQLSSS